MQREDTAVLLLIKVIIPNKARLLPSIIWGMTREKEVKKRIYRVNECAITSKIRAS